MILLDATTKSLEVLLSGAVATTQLPIVASFADITATTFLPGATDTQTNNATAVTAAAAPGASTQRQVKFVNIWNADTAPVTVTVRVFIAGAPGTARILQRVTLPVGAALVYVDGAGWSVMTSTGPLAGPGGDVVGPASAVADAIAVYNGTTGKLVKDGGSTIAGVLATALAAGLAATLSIRQATVIGIGGDFSSNSLTLVDVTGVTITLTTGALAKVLILVTIPVLAGTPLFDWRVDGVDNGTVQGFAVNSGVVTLFKMVTGLSAASHTFQLRTRSSSGTPNTQINMSSTMNGSLIALEIR